MTAPPDTGTSAPRGCTNLKLRQAGRRATRFYEDHLRATGLKITQYSLLSHVVQPGGMGAGALAAALRMDASTLTRNLQPLLQQGWVTVRSGADARSRIVEATAEGRAVRAQAQKAWKRAQLDLNHRLGAERVAQLHALLDACIAALDDEGEPDDDTP